MKKLQNILLGVFIFFTVASLVYMIRRDQIQAQKETEEQLTAMKAVWYTKGYKDAQESCMKQLDASW